MRKTVAVHDQIHNLRPTPGTTLHTGTVADDAVTNFGGVALADTTTHVWFQVQDNVSVRFDGVAVTAENGMSLPDVDVGTGGAARSPLYTMSREAFAAMTAIAHAASDAKWYAQELTAR